MNMKENFEVHPIGTTTELRKLREFVSQVADIIIEPNDNDKVARDIAKLTGNLQLWYVGHNEKHDI